MKLGFSVLVVLCLAVFAVMSGLLSRRLQATVNEISGFYMSAMNDQLQQKFSLIIELTLEKLDGVVNRTPPGPASYGEDLLEDLRASASARNFVYLGFLKKDGSLETIYGEDISITGGENVLSALSQNQKIAEMGRDADGGGDHCILLGRAAAYPTSDGTRSAALVAGISADYLSGVIFADTDDDVIFSHIIDQQGDYVIRTHLPGSVSENYLDYIRSEMEGISPETAGHYISSLETAIRDRTRYIDSLTVAGEERRVYCVPLNENSTWYLVTVMPYGFLDEAITAMNRDRMLMLFVSCLILFLALALLFWQYYRLTRAQMRALDAAREEASRANRSKSNFLSSMSHDIRTPMNAIVGMSEIAIKNLDDRARVQDCLKKVQLSSKQLLGLINDILDMSKIESGKMTLREEVLSLREAMNALVSIVQPQIQAGGQRFNIFIRDVLSERVWCDSVRLNQILLNLLSNAIKFTPEGGKINVSLRQEASPKGDGWVRTHLQVDDTGIGMSPEFLERLFDSFERESTNRVHHITGSGLGMSITKRIVDLMGGTIQVQSQEGKGSSFHVTLDMRRAAAEAEMRLPSSWNALVIDDSEQLCESAAANLEELGVSAEWALDCGQALELAEARRARGERYDFILVDWEMPRVSGAETVRALRARLGEAVPIYLISAYDWSDIKDLLNGMEIAGFIPKPLFKSTLYDCLSQRAGDGAAASAPSRETVDLTGTRVLLAEDNDLNWEVARELLGEAGLELERAENGRICADKFLRSPAGYYSAILMDIHMPVLDGYGATELIRAASRPDRDLPIIAMTADAFSDDVQRCLDVGMNYHLPKPLDFQMCVNVLSRYLNKEKEVPQ